VDLTDGSQETFLELLPPAVPLSSANSLPQRLLDLFVVLDCSGSMEGHRIRAANQALKSMYEHEHVESLTLIRFGGKTTPAQTFQKCQGDKLPTFRADLGATQFIPALEELRAALARRLRVGVQNTHAPLAVFISDGACHDNPQSTISELGNFLEGVGCQLMSVAITTEVRPDIMVAISDMNGALPFLLIHDKDAERELAEQLLEHLPLDRLHEKLRVRFTCRTGEQSVVDTVERTFSRDGSSIRLTAPRTVPFDDMGVTLALLRDGSEIPAEVQLLDMAAVVE